MINYHLKDEDKEVYAIIQEELNRQRNKLEMIASENIVSYGRISWETLLWRL